MKFIVFEGLDGSGKSSLMSALEKELSRRAISTLRTREPGGTPLGEEIRQLILQKKGGLAPTARTELLLYEASRAQHVDEVILPALQKGSWVLCDRFTASSIAFQAGGRDLSMADVVNLNNFATKNLKIDLTILLDLSVEESRQRRQGRGAQTGESEDRIESESNIFHERVRQSFLALSQEQNRSYRENENSASPWLVLNAAESPEKLLTTLLTELSRKGWL